MSAGHQPPANGARPSAPHARLGIALDLGILAALLAFTFLHLPPHLLLLDTMTVGGDTPAHNYLASHLREQLFQHGRLVSWAPGWWAGFPMFQYYFCLPYLLMALLSLALPFNIAFKCISVLGVFILPGCAYTAARLLRLPRPTPILLAIAMLPFLFVRTHVMWGVNLYSTLAGMIANSISFPIMLLTIGSVYRDAVDGRPRLRSAFLAALLLSSHFFTSIMAAVTLAPLPLLLPRTTRRAALLGMLPTAILAGLLMAWWLLPLVVTQEWSVDFGNNWRLPLTDTLPRYALWLMPFALTALGLAWRSACRPAVWLLGWMFAAAGALYFWGYGLTPVFVDVRLWPFIFFALMALAAVGAGLLADARPGRGILPLAVLSLALLAITEQERGVRDGKSPVRTWAEFNFGGLERRPGYPVFRDLILPLDGTPGRLANDLAEANNAMGSSRILEAVPHLIDKPILEGGLVNSGLSSYFAYSIQCEMSESCSGYPTIVNPSTFDVAHGTRHLELFNVKHFLARWPTVQDALRVSPDWKFLRESSGWQLFELTTHDGHVVTVPRFWPLAVTTDHWKEQALEWFYTIDLVDQPIVFSPTPLTLPGAPPALSEAAFRQAVTSKRGGSGDLDEWLHLGPFPYPQTSTDPLAFAPIPEAGLDPRAGDAAGGRLWRTLFTRSPIFPGRLYDQDQFVVAYSFVNIFCPTERDAVLHYSNDDGVAMTLNDEPVVRDGITGLGTFREQPVHLRAGRNRLLHKTQQSVGGHFFHVRLTDPAGAAFSDVTVTAEREPPPRSAFAQTPIGPLRQTVLSESVDARHIRFRTDAVGLPHLISCSYFPNWKVRGAARIYRVTPAFMLVYPEQPDVELTFGRTGADWAGLGLTAIGWMWVGARLVCARRGRGRAATT